MPVRKRSNRRSTREGFDVTPVIKAAFDAYIASKPTHSAVWAEHWILHDLLNEAGVLQLPFIPPCCYHPEITSIQWPHLPHAVAIYNHLARL